MLRKLMTGFMLLAVLPSTSNYGLGGYGFGSGGVATSTTATYSLEGGSGELTGPGSSTSNYKTKPGFSETIQANVPSIATFDNGGGSYYNKLHFVINTQNNPSDALYSLQISTSSTFASGNNYVKSDLTIGGTLVLADYQTYTAWGGASGANIIGLQPNTAYYLRVKATNGKYTESPYGPISGPITTANPFLTFSISTNSLAMGLLLAGTVVNSPSDIGLTFATNANSGGDVYISGLNGGLKSTAVTSTITSATGDLSALSRGFGARVSATGASSGTISSVSPYNGASNNVGIVNTTIRKILSATAPVTGGTSSITIKAKSASNDPAANDYTETLTLLASGSF